MKKIDVSGWKEYRIGDLFTVVKGTRLTKAQMTPGDIRFIGSSAMNNGCTATIGNTENMHPANTITVCYNGSVGETFYQDKPFLASDDVNVLYPKFDMTKEMALFIVPLIKLASARYSYIDKWKREDMIADTIKLPANASGEPDWQFMEDYIKEIQKKVQNKIFKQKGNKKKIDIATAENKTEKKWEKYRIGDLFKILLSKDDIQPKLVNEGSFPLVSSGKENNGICAYIEKQDAKLWDAGLLTVDMFGKAFYQEKPFYCVSHGRVNILIPKKDMSEMSLRFIGAVIEKTTMEKYDFQEMCTGTKLAEEFVFLPFGDNGQPDLEGIEKFMCSIADNSRDTLSRITAAIRYRG